MPRIMLSLLTIALVVAVAVGATLAFFQTTTTFANDPSVLSTTGDVTFVAVLTNDSGVPTAFTGDLYPGAVIERCLWIRNTGDVPARFKVYMKPGSETGDSSLGNALRLDAQATPDTGRCTDNPPQISGATTKYTNFTDTNWTNVQVRGGGFYTDDTTPFMSDADGDAMGANHYSVWQFDLRLPETTDSAIANKTYQFQGELFAIQDGGSFGPSGSPVASGSPGPTILPSASPSVTPSALPTVSPSASPDVSPSVLPTETTTGDDTSDN